MCATCGQLESAHRTGRPCVLNRQAVLMLCNCVLCWSLWKFLTYDTSVSINWKSESGNRRRSPEEAVKVTLSKGERILPNWGRANCQGKEMNSPTPVKIGEGSQPLNLILKASHWGLRGGIILPTMIFHLSTLERPFLSILNRRLSLWHLPYAWCWAFCLCSLYRYIRNFLLLNLLLFCFAFS